jgi:hypothetical protein
MMFIAPIELLLIPTLAPPVPPTKFPVILTTPPALLVSNGVDPPAPVAVQLPVIVNVPVQPFEKARPVCVPAEVTINVPVLLFDTPIAALPAPVTVPTIVAEFGEAPA